MSRELTKEEVTEGFLNYIRDLIYYWNNTSNTSLEKLEGLAFSILVTLDGESKLPKFIVAPDPHSDDKEYFISNKENYYPENNNKINCDIAGELHHKLHI